MKTLAIAAVAAMMMTVPAMANEAGTSDKMEAVGAYMVKKLDKNNDNQISKDEHQAGAEAMFTAADVDNNNQLTATEIANAKAAEKRDMEAEMGVVKH